MKAIDIIRDEHRSFAAILQGLRHLVTETQAGRMQPNFILFDAMLRYVEGFPERSHHPKEDQYLFPAIRRHAPELEPVIDELERQHDRGRVLIKQLRETFERWRQGGASDTQFAAAVEEYADFHWKHMRIEEDQILVAAGKNLPVSETEAIDAAFTSNQDPMSGVGRGGEFRELFRRIVTLAPAPLGVGPSEESAPDG